MITGHTRFGLIKQKYRRSESDTIDHLVRVVNDSAACNYAQVYRREDGSSNWKWRSWDTYLLNYFKPLQGIRKLHHFRFSSSDFGIVHVKESVHDQEVAVSILKAPVDESALTSALLPPELTSAGLSYDRKQYLYNSIREHVRTDFRDKLCPNPNV